MNHTEYYAVATESIDLLYGQEKTTEIANGEELPKELLYAQRMVAMLLWFYPQADEAHLLAARCQHLCRWDIPRSDYPLDKKGYHAWRTYLYQYQAGKAADVLRSSGYDDDTVSRVSCMVSKTGIKTIQDTQLIEDVICLVFVRYYLEDFSERYKDDLPKLFEIIQKTWRKMSDQGHSAIMKLPLNPHLMATLKAALAV